MSILKELFTPDQLEILRLTGELPILLTTRQTAAVLGVKPHDVRAFISAGALTPLAFPLSEADGYFWRPEVLALALAENKLRCVKARKAMKLKWEANNGRSGTDACAASAESGRQIPPTLVKEVEDKILETYLRAEQIYQRTFELPSVDWNLRGTCAGSATWKQNLIRLNPILLCENKTQFINETVPHEVAHLLNRALNGPLVSPHGPEWCGIMVALGLAPQRCHTYDITNARVRQERRYSYKCNCRPHSISQRIRNRLMRGAVYRCVHCGSEIQPAQAQPRG